MSLLCHPKKQRVAAVAASSTPPGQSSTAYQPERESAKTDILQAVGRMSEARQFCKTAYDHVEEILEHRLRLTP